MAKGLGGGYPIGAIWAAEKNAELFQPGSHGSTFGGTPLACAAALAVLDVIERENLLQKVQANGAAWRTQLEQLAVDFPAQVKGVSGRGYMLGLILQSEPGPYLAALRDEGLLAPMAGGNTVRLLPPLITTLEQLTKATAIIRSVLIKKGKNPSVS
jgi:acetylornithine aminotransferase/acetylornithine/N-succinyldiaminopimelate aminotransferase